MSMTEDELRDLLRSRTQNAPAVTGLAESAEAAGRRARAGIRAGVAAALVAVLAVSAAIALPRQGAEVPPVGPTPSISEGALIVEQELNGVRVRTSGPAAIQGEEPFTLTLQVTNPGSQDWTGEVGVGLVREAVPAPAGFSLLVPDDPSGEPAPDVLTGATSELGSGRTFEGASTVVSVRIAAGATSTWTVQLRRNPEAAVIGTPIGWVGYVMPGDVGDPMAIDPVGDGGRALDIAPRSSSLGCDEVSNLTWERTGDQEWRLTRAEQVIVEQDGAQPTIGSAESMDVVDVSLDAGSAPAPAWAVLRAVDAAGTGASTTTGLTEVPLNPEAFPQAGTFIRYSASSMVDIRFSGTCEPSGEPVSGVATLNGDGAVSGGIVDCATGPEATPAARLAAAYCPST